MLTASSIYTGNMEWKNNYKKLKEMKQLTITLSMIFLLLLPSIANASGVTELEGSFKMGPAIILITILILFIVVDGVGA